MAVISDNIFLEKADDLVFVVGFDGMLKYVNIEWETKTGYSIDKVLATPYLSHFHPKDIIQVEHATKKLKNGQRNVVFKSRLRSQGGKANWYKWTFTSNGSSDTFLGTGKAIKQEVLPQIFSLPIQSALQDIPVMLNAFDEKMDLLVWNQPCEKLTGYTTEEMVGNPVAMNKLYPNKEYRNKIMGIWMDRDFLDIQDFETEITCKNGEKRVIIWNFIGRSNPVPEWYSWGVGIDITAQRNAEKEITIKEERLNLAVQESDFGIWDIDLITGDSYWSPKFLELLGYAPEEKVSDFSFLMTHVHPEDRAKMEQEIHNHLYHYKPYHHEFRCYTKSGKLQWFRTGGGAVRDNKGVPIRMAGVWENITKRKLAEITLNENRQWLQLALKASRQATFDFKYDKANTFLATYSDELYHILGYPTDTFEIDANRWLLLMHQEDAKVIRSILRNTFKTPSNGHDSLSIEFRMLTNYGQYKWFFLKGEVTEYGLNKKPTRIVGVIHDIDERKRNREKLVMSEQNFRNLYNKTPVMLQSIDRVGRILTVSDYWLDTMGYSRNQVIGKKGDLFLSKGSALKMADSCQGMTGEGFHYQFQKKNGEVIETLLSTTPQRDPDGNITHYLQVITNVTERIKAENALKESEERFRKVIESTTNAILLVNDNGSIELFNESAKKLFGYSSEEWASLNIKQLIPKRWQHVFYKYHRRRANQHMEDMWTGKDFTALNKEKEEIPVEIGLNGVIINGIPYTLAVVTDIAKRKAAEEALLEINRRHSSLINHIPGMVYRCAYSLERPLEFLSSPSSFITGYNPDDLNLKQGTSNFNDYIHPDDQEESWNMITTSISSGEPYKVSYRILGKGGESIWVLDQGNGVLDSKGKLIALEGCIFDITDRVRSEERVISAILETEDKERRRISKEIHDSLQQALIVTSLNLRAIKPELTGKKIEEKFDTAYTYLQSALKQSRTIAYNLMPKAIEDFGYVMALESLTNDLSSTTDTIFDCYNNLNNNRLALPVEVSLFRITQEALNNIIKYAKAKKASIQLVKLESKIQLTIEDDGIGFQKEKIEAGKTGMGLAGMKNRASAIGGSLFIDSIPGEGTTILVEIPITKT